MNNVAHPDRRAPTSTWCPSANRWRASCDQAPSLTALVSAHCRSFLQVCSHRSVSGFSRQDQLGRSSVLSRWVGVRCLLDGLPTRTRIAVASLPAGPGTMRVGVVVTGGPVCTAGPESGLRACRAAQDAARTASARREISLKAVGSLRPSCRSSERASAGVSHNFRSGSQYVCAAGIQRMGTAPEWSAKGRLRP